MRLAIIPAIFLVMISYSSFFIDPQGVSSRTTLGVIPILTSFTLLGATMRSLPRFSYVSWMNEFLFVHVLFNVIAMLEFALIAYIQRKAELEKEQINTTTTEVDL